MRSNENSAKASAVKYPTFVRICGQLPAIAEHRRELDAYFVFSPTAGISAAMVMSMKILI